MPKFNLYKIYPSRKTGLVKKLEQAGLEKISEKEIDDFTLQFYFSNQPDAVDIWWTEIYGNFFPNPDTLPTNKIYFATMLVFNKTVCYAISLGKAHFYLKKFCDSDFGLNLAERIINEKTIKIKNSKFYKSKRNKTITSYHGGTDMDYSSGESMHYLKAATIDETIWGKTGNFGNSVQLKLDMTPEDLPELITLIETELTKKSRFKLPKTELVKDEAQIKLLDSKLVKALKRQVTDSSIQVDDFSVSGIDFIFTDRDSYSLYLSGNSKGKTEPLDLTIDNLLRFVKQRGIDLATQINDIRVMVHNEHGRGHSKPIKEFLDYIDNDDRYCLIDGKWYRFNQAYLTYLRKEVDKLVIH